MAEETKLILRITDGRKVVARYGDIELDIDVPIGVEITVPVGAIEYGESEYIVNGTKQIEGTLVVE